MGRRKSQVAMEYIFFVALVIGIVLVSLYVIYNDYRTQVHKKEMMSLEDLGKSIQAELFLAADMNDGYYRTIYLPDSAHDFFHYDIDNFNYEIIINGTRVGDMGFPTPLFYGTFQKGTENIIYKENGTIYVTQ